jgi:RsiW-degrading membrane proteinase PrsW (M82 family)
LCEEYIKFRIIKKYIYHHPQFNEIMDGIIYTVVASLGFACMENVLYVLKSSWHTALARGFTAVPMHAVCSGMMGYYIGLARFSCDKNKEKRLLNQGLWTAILLHGLYDFLLFISPIWGSVFSLLAIILILVVYLLLKEKIHMARRWDTKPEHKL